MRGHRASWVPFYRAVAERHACPNCGDPSMVPDLAPRRPAESAKDGHERKFWRCPACWQRIEVSA